MQENQNQKPNKSNIFVKFFRFFYPKGGYNKNFQIGISTGKQIGEQKAKEYKQQQEIKKKH
jgi:hypothetical protein